MTLDKGALDAPFPGQPRNGEMVASSSPFSNQLLGMVGMCYGKGRKGDQNTAKRGIKALSSSILCVGPRSEKIERIPITEEENIPENAQGPQGIPPQLLSIPEDGEESKADEQEIFCDAMSTLNSSRNSMKSASTTRTRKSRAQRTKKRPHTDLGFMTPLSLDCRPETGFQTPYCDDVTNLTLTNLEDKRRAYNSVQHTLGREERRSRLMEMSDCLLDAAQTCVNQAAGDDCSVVYHKKGLKVWKKEFGVGRVLLRAEYIVPFSPQQFSEFASNTTCRKMWDTNVEDIGHVETIAPDVHVTYTAVKRIATIYPRDTVALRIVRRLEGNTQDESDSFASCSCSVEHPDVPERSGKVRADIHLGFYVAKPFPCALGEWSSVRLFHEGDPKGWIPSSVMKMFATKVIPGSVERLLKAMAEHNGINWMESGSGTATNYAAHMLEKHELSFEIPVAVPETTDKPTPPNRFQGRSGSPKSLASDAGDIPFAQSIGPNVWRVE